MPLKADQQKYTKNLQDLQNIKLNKILRIEPVHSYSEGTLGVYWKVVYNI